MNSKTGLVSGTGRKWAAFALAAATGLGSVVSLSFADDTKGDAKEAPAPRSKQAIVADLRTVIPATMAEIKNLKTGDPAAVKAAAPKLTPDLKKMISLLDEYEAELKQKPAELESMKTMPKGLLYLMDDKETKEAVDADAAGTGDEAAVAKGVQLESKWIAADQDKAAQDKIADEMIKLDSDNPKSTGLTMQTYAMAEGADSDTAKKKLFAVLRDTMKNPAATQLRGPLKLASLEGQPFVMTGKTVDGKEFTTADWKGKVVMVDFWATWCGPCKAGLPEVKETYKKYHDQGFEIVGVSNDFSPTDLSDFTAKNDMPWPQLYNADAGAKHQWNPTTLGYGINGIPTMFLIDKKGVLRSVKAREQMQTLIPKLLAE